MGSDNFQDRPGSIENDSYGELEETESNNIDSLEVVSSGGASMLELESAAEVLTRVELDITCSSEKLINLDIIVMHVASRENDDEAFALEGVQLESPIVKALELDMLYGFLDSEIRELESFLSALHTEIVSCREVVSSFTHHGDTLHDIEEKMRDCEDSLKRSFEQVSHMKMQSANFQRTLLASSGDEKWKNSEEVGCLENCSSTELGAKIKIQTAEQQRNVLRMLEKSLVRELGLEKKLTESRETEEGLKLWLEQKVFCIEQEAEDIWQRLFEAENSAEILFGVSKELFGQIQMAQFSINGSIEREGELRSKLEDFSEQNKELREQTSKAEKRAEIAEADCKKLRESNMELSTDVSHLKSNITDAANQVEQLETQLKDSEIKRLLAVESAEAIQENQSMLDCTIKDMDDVIKDLKSKVLRTESELDSAEDRCITLSEINTELNEEIQFLRRKMEHLETSLMKASEAEKRAEIAEAECKNLRESNMELSTDVSHLKSNITDAANQVEQLETKLKDSETKLLHAVASAEASQEHQSMLDCTIEDMENLIKDLKSKVLRAESELDSAEDKCIMLSETNTELIEEINFLRRRMEHFETSLHQADEVKKETAKDIRVQTKLITDLVLQLALERERLHKQISSLTNEKRVAVKFLQRKKDPSVTVIGGHEAKVKEFKFSKNYSENENPEKEVNEEITGSSAISYQVGASTDNNAHTDSSKTGTNLDDPSSELYAVRNIDAGQLKFKYVSVIFLILVIPALASFMYSAVNV